MGHAFTEPSRYSQLGTLFWRVLKGRAISYNRFIVHAFCILLHRLDSPPTMEPSTLGMPNKIPGLSSGIASPSELPTRLNGTNPSVPLLIGAEGVRRRLRTPSLRDTRLTTDLSFVAAD